MKLIVPLALSAVLPFLSGCITTKTLDAAKTQASQTILYDSVNKMETAGITKDSQLCIFFEKDLTNSLQKSRLTLTVPLAQIQTNTHYYYEAFHPNRRIYALQVPRSAIRPNCTLLKKSKSDLVFIPIGTDLNPDALQAGDFMLLSNATQTVYLTRTSPVEFVYVDSSMKVPFTSVTVAPTIVTKRHPAYYLLLPLTIPADIATAPFQIIGLWAIAVVCHQ